MKKSIHCRESQQMYIMCFLVVNCLNTISSWVLIQGKDKKSINTGKRGQGDYIVPSFSSIKGKDAL